MDEQTRLKWLDGLKGLACLGVFTHHFALAFYNTVYFGDKTPSLLHGFDTWLATSPAGVFLNGNFWVCLFILIMAFLAAAQVIRTQDSQLRDKLSSMLLRRYPRLLPQAFAAAVLNFLLVHLMDYLQCNYSGKELGYGVGRLFYHGILRTWTTPDPFLLGPFWTLHYFLFGYFAAVLLAVLSCKKKRWIYVLYLACLFPAFLIDVYYVPVVMGVLLADTVIHGRIPSKNRPTAAGICSIILILAGLFCGGYPSYGQPDNVYRIFRLPAMLTSRFYILIHTGGAFLLMSGLLLLFSDRKSVFLASRPCRALGKISYSVYLLHIMWIEYLGVFLMDRFTEICGSRALAGIPVYLILLVLLLFSAGIFQGVEDRVRKVLHRRVNREFRKHGLLWVLEMFIDFRRNWSGFRNGAE